MRNWQNWPEVQGRVERADWNCDRYPDYAPYVSVAYSYTVNGERYGGHMEKEFNTEEEAVEFVTGVRDQEVIVRYQADKPDKSVVPSLL